LRISTCFKNSKKQKLLKELSSLTGKEIVRFKFREVDYKEKEAKIDIFFRDI
jgi:hypothetical protein